VTMRLRRGIPAPSPPTMSTTSAFAHSQRNRRTAGVRNPSWSTSP